MRQLSGRSRLAQIESNYGEVLWPKTRNVPTHRVSVKQGTIASTAAPIAKPLELPWKFNAIVGIPSVRKRNRRRRGKREYLITCNPADFGETAPASSLRKAEYAGARFFHATV